MSEVEFEIIEIKIPKTIFPMLEGVGKLAGKNIETLLTDIIRCEFQDLFEQPYHIIDYLDRVKCGIFREFEQGLEQWKELSGEKEKDHKQEEKAHAST